MLQVKTSIKNGAQIAVQTLKNAGVDSIFGYPGSVVLKLYDELSKQTTIKHYLVRHEQSAVHAAEGYAQITGKPGVVLVTSGPGATNIVTGAANAYLDGTPLVIITGQVDSCLLGQNAFQEIDILDITKSCTKAGFQVKDINNLEQTLIKAFEIAQEGRKGPVIVDITKNVFTQSAVYKALMPELCTVSKLPALENCQNLINICKRPVIIAGAGVLQSNAQDELYNFSKKINAPVVTTMLGLDAISWNEENAFRMIGIYGENSANETIRQSDLLIILGARLNDRITSCFTPEDFDKKIIQVDINKDELGRNIQVTEGIQADIKEFLKNLEVNPHSREWLEQAMLLKSLDAGINRRSNLLHSTDAIKGIFEFSDIITTEVGQHQICTVKNFKSGVKFITSGGLGTMGFGLPAAIGATIAAQKTVVCIAGDGSFQMSLPELAVIKNYNLPVKIMIMNNGYLGMVRQLQKENDFATKLVNPDFVKLAESYGIKALRVSKSSEVEPALKLAFQCEEPFLIDFIVEPFEEV